MGRMKRMNIDAVRRPNYRFAARVKRYVVYQDGRSVERLLSSPKWVRGRVTCFGPTRVPASRAIDILSASKVRKASRNPYHASITSFLSTQAMANGGLSGA